MKDCPQNRHHRTLSGYWILTVMLCMTGCLLKAQQPCTEFWLSFDRNPITPQQDTGLFGTGHFGTDNYYEIQIHAMHQANGHIIFTQTKDSVAFSIPSGQIFSYRLTYSQAKNCSNDTLDTKDNLSVCVLSDSAITVSVMARKIFSADASLILPLEALGCEYNIYQQLGNYSTSQKKEERCIIIGTQNNTLVNLDGQPLCSLDRGETYYFSIDYFATGKQRALHSNHPIALFSADKSNCIPLWGIVDRCYEQYFPVHAAGTAFYIPASVMGSDFIQVVATENNTNLTVSGGTLRTDISGPGRLNGLNARQWAWIETTVTDKGCHITADKPVLAYSFLPSCNFKDPLGIFTGVGDPAVVCVPALNQREKSCSVKPFTLDNQTNKQYHAMIVVPTAGKNSCTVSVNNGTFRPLFGGIWKDHPSGWSYYDMPLQEDSSYIFSNYTHGLQVYSYGLAQTESYYLLASAKFRNWKRSFTANDTHYLKLPELFFCEQEITFQAEVADSLSTKPGHIRWYIDSVEEVSARDSLAWKKYFTKGNYHIRMEIRYNDEFDTNAYNITSTLRITSLEADIRTTPEHCRQSDGSIVLTVSTDSPDSLTFALDSVGGFSNSISGLKAGWHHIRIQDTYCEWQQQVYIDSVTGPTADFNVSDTVAMINTKLRFTDHSAHGSLGNSGSSNGTGIMMWHWDMGDNTTYNTPNILHTYASENVFTVQMAVTDSNFCSDTTQKNIRVVDNLSFPNVFTPESDVQQNKVFQPLKKKGLYTTFEMHIYNRWGNLVWEQQCHGENCPDYDDKDFWWNGTNSHGKPVSAGVYFWTVKASCNQDIPPLFLNGSVTVIR